MTMPFLIALALPGAAVAQGNPPIDTCQKERPLSSRPAGTRGTETLPPITPAPPEVEAMVAPEYGGPKATARSDPPR